ncbi:hypothetical protein [Terriglobus saanensis]|uniref:Alcohol dehydrogenase GroES-like protein n=1 Tax=Terriglobus saanensis (strain ATCC BAA-1853 / DSM 23119 / SP1PR4) TaxID=401053 RepID=E8V238_TERSS|nr:hypothetical protein [Terriglobus saanensis]ADV84595.1 alcohol dehydrogenase GroES-like protein [Terriglobus saanensis SP1PR4]
MLGAITEERKVLSDLPGLGSVSLCACGTVHLAVGAVTVRMAPEAFVQMMSMCREALHLIAQDPSLCEPQPLSPLTH